MVGSLKSGAGERIRTVNIHLGKVVLYQLSYAREWTKSSRAAHLLSSICA